MIGWLAAAAWAGSAVVTIEVGAGPLGPLEVLDATGDPLASIAVPDPRIRSLILPGGGGETTQLPRALGRYEVPWPEGAQRVRLGDQEAFPTVPPVTREGVVAVQQAGLPSERLDLLFLGDGYSDAELVRFADDVDAIVAHLATIEPYSAYTSLLNIWRVDTASPESGVTHQETGVSRETAFGCYYGCGGLDRLVCCDEEAVLDAAAKVGPVEGVVVLVNDPVYGGSGGFTYAVAYNGADGVEVAAHELGHSLVLLRDEYPYGSTESTAFTGPNCSASENELSWAEWLGVDGVDAYEVCSYDNFWRPTEDNCMMLTLQDNYCPVCREAAVLALYERIPDLLAAVSPEVETTVDATGAADPVIAVETIVPAELLQFEWSVDGEIAADQTGPELRPRCHPELAGEVTVRVLDPTPWVREDPQDLLQSTSGPWTVLAERCLAPAPPDAPCGCRSAAPTPTCVAIALLWLFRRRR